LELKYWVFEPKRRPSYFGGEKYLGGEKKALNYQGEAWLRLCDVGGFVL
jgi:hypothetical protein